MEINPSTDVVDRVMEALKQDDRTRGCSFDVAHERGVVSLRGEVPNAGVREAAEQVARQQNGVITVINEVIVV